LPGVTIAPEDIKNFHPSKNGRAKSDLSAYEIGLKTRHEFTPTPFS
jgi:hypothetical protein